MMPYRKLRWTVGLGIALCAVLAASAQDRVANLDEAREVYEERGRTMKSLGRSMRTLKGFAGGRGSAEAASEAVAVIAAAAPRIPSLFPAGSGREAIHDSESRDAIWAQWDEFVAGAERLGGKAAALEAAIASGDGSAVAAAFGDLGKDGCGGCHRRFREKHEH